MWSGDRVTRTAPASGPDTCVQGVQCSVAQHGCMLTRAPATATRAGAKNAAASSAADSGANMRRNYSTNAASNYSHLQPSSSGNSGAAGFQVSSSPSCVAAEQACRAHCCSHIAPVCSHHWLHHQGPSPVPACRADITPSLPACLQGFDSEGDSSNWGEQDWLGNQRPPPGSRPGPAHVPKSASTGTLGRQPPQQKPANHDDDDWGKW